MKNKILLFVILSVLFGALPNGYAKGKEMQSTKQTKLAKPTPKQIRFADWEVGAFFHYDLNIFTGQEHGDGQEPPSKFNPTNLDIEQWIKTAKSMGARYACLTARHEGGFCLWPSKTTEYTIANSPYKNGKGDLVREFVDACRKYDIVPALYHTAAFDANAALGSNYKGKYKLPLEWGSTWGMAQAEVLKDNPERRAEIKALQVEQMRELLTNYGPIGFMWSDHWDATDPNGVWRAVTNLAAELQPNMVFMGPESWVPGNETGHVVYPMWNAVNTKDGTNNSRPEASSVQSNTYGLLETDVLTGHPLGKYWRVRECTTNSGFGYGGWFWHPENHTKTYPRKLWEHLDLYYRTVGLGANTIINLPINDKGLVPDDFVKAAKRFGDDIQKRFSSPIAEQKKVIKGNTIELSWKKSKEINTVVLMENIANGQRIVKYALDAWVDGEWQPITPMNRLVAVKPYNPRPGFETIGHKKIDRIKPVVTNKVRFRCLNSLYDEAELRSFAVYKCDPITRVFDSEYPYFSGFDTEDDAAHGGLIRDKNYVGKKAYLGGKHYPYSLMVCPVGDLKYGFATFDMKPYQNERAIAATIGIEDLRDKLGTAYFVVEGIKAGKTTELYRSPLMRGESKPIDINVSLPKGLDKLTFRVLNAGDTHWNDHALWGNLRFVK